MTESLREKLESELGTVRYDDLAAHAKRGALFVAAGEASLLDIAEALATDDKAKCEAWLESGDLRRPLAEEMDAWSAEGAAHFFDFSIVQPFVVVRVRDLES